MKEWIVRLPGKDALWRHGPTGAFPRMDPGKAHTQVQALLFQLRKAAVLTAARSMHKALTGQQLTGAFSPFEVSGEREARVLGRSLVSGLTAGRLQVSEVAPPPIAITLPEEFVPAALGPATVAETESVFEVCLLDVAGTALSGVEVTFSSQGKQEKKKTDGNGVARFEGFEGSFGSLSIDPKSLAEVAEPLWEKGVKPVKFKGKVDQIILTDKVEPLTLESELRRTVVFRPEPGILSLELRDKTGQFAYADCEYAVSGPMTFEGVTDEKGRLRHEEVAPGDYEVSVTVEYNEKLKLEPKTFKMRAVVLDAGDGEPQIRLIGAVPFVRMARLRGLLFDLNKTFLLPTALEGLEGFRDLAEEMGPAHLLIVGHTDTSGEPSINDPLSKKRAESVQQYLERDVDAWLENYSGSGAGVWGNREDRLMIRGLCDAEVRKRQASGGANAEFGPAEDEDIITFYQRFHNQQIDEGLKPEREKLEEDGVAGDKTRKELVTDYMALGGLGWTAIKDLPLTIELHGCGENFPLDGTGLELDARAVAERDGERDRVDRRVELFFFDSTFKVAPAITGPSGEEYLTWREFSREDRDVPVEGVKNKATKLPITDAHFRTGSAVMLPEGTAPSTDGAPPLTSVGALAVALRFNEDRPGQRMLIAGHTDSVGSDASNDKLSVQRGELVHAVLMGGDEGRSKFVDLAVETGTVSDWKQILKWSAAAFPAVDPLFPSDSEEDPPEASGEDGELGTGFSLADPGIVDDDAASGAVAVEAFQEAYNENFKLLGGAGTIAVDGDVGKETWGAIYDLYQYNMAQELGEDFDGVGKLRELATFLLPDDPFLGFGESAPVDGIMADNVEAQANRRVEVLFFQKGQEPDLAVLKEDPKASELYLPDSFERQEVTMRTARRFRYAIQLLGFDLEPSAGSKCRVAFAGQAKELTSSGGGLIQFTSEVELETCEIEYEPHDVSGVTVRRTLTFEPAVATRLENLGYIQVDDDEDDRLVSFRREFAIADDVAEEDVNDMILRWHDQGKRPEAASDGG